MRDAAQEIFACLLQENVLHLVQYELSEQLGELLDLPAGGGLHVCHPAEESLGELLPGRHEERARGPDIPQGGVTADQSEVKY